MSPHRIPVRAARRGINWLAMEVGSRTIAWVIVALTGIGLGLILVTIGGYLLLASQQHKNTHTAHDLRLAVCALRVEETKRIAGSEAFLRQHPHGFLGITPAEIEKSIQQYRTTQQALRFVDCHGLNPPSGA